MSHSINSINSIWRYIPNRSVVSFPQVTVPGEKPKKYCGEESPGVIHTGSHTVQLEYHTDGAGQSRGWSLHYTTQSESAEHSRR